VEGVSPSDITTSEETAAELISCPEQIITLPGWFVIFAVRGKSAVNLKDSGLTFTLNDSSVGWVTDPFYLKCMGAWNYNIAYGIFLAKPALSTPVSTTIIAQTTTGLSVNIFTEVVKNCASVSGHVGGAGVIPAAGFVYSIGFDSFSCLDGAGNYKLDRVFRGHFRNVVAVYWLMENGVLTKHREERTIDFFDGDLTGFDLPAGVLPTPTVRPPGDPFYDIQVTTVLDYYAGLKEQFGPEGYVKTLAPRKLYFEEQNSDPLKNFDGSIICMSHCWSGDLQDAFSSAEYYFGHFGPGYPIKQNAYFYYLFYFMMFGPGEPVDIPMYDPSNINLLIDAPPNRPLSARESFDALNDYYKANSFF